MFFDVVETAFLSSETEVETCHLPVEWLTDSFQKYPILGFDRLLHL